MRAFALMVVVAAAARREGLEALRGAGADVDDETVGEMIGRLRASLNAGRAPRSKAEEVARVAQALDPVAVRLCLGCPELPGDEAAAALWAFVEGAVRGTQAESRVRRVASDEAGWQRISEQIWLKAIGEDVDDESWDYSLHLGTGLLLAGTATIWLAEA